MIGISKKRLDKKYSDLEWPFVFSVGSLQQSYAPPPPPMAPPSPGNTTGGGGGGGGGHGGGLVEQLSKTNLYIRGLPPATTDQDLIKLCQPWVLFSRPFYVKLIWHFTQMHPSVLLSSTYSLLSLWGNLFWESNNSLQWVSTVCSWPLMSLPCAFSEEKTKPSWPYPIRSHSALGSSTHACTWTLHRDITHKALFNQKYQELSVPGGLGGELRGYKKFLRPMIVCSSTAAWVLCRSCKSANFLDADTHRGPMKCLLTL